MKRPTSKRPPSAPRDDLEARLTRVLSEAKEALGPKQGARAAQRAFAAALASVFGPEGDDVDERRGGDALLTRQTLGHEYPAIIGESPAILAVLGKLDRIVASELPVLITGESGTGKELVARAIHENGPRKGRAFVRENCAAIPESLLESELFGYRRGAFTGAHGDKRGLFEEGDGGSVFLDEIGEMSLGMQSKLMRVLQEGEIRPVGASASTHVDIRLISATNRDLRKLVADGRFREDLFFRLNVLPVELPPLRERPEDVPVLVDFFLKAAAVRTHSAPKHLDAEALAALKRYRWPGNVRELENEIQRAVALSGGSIKASDLSPEVVPGRGKAPRSSNRKAR
jgi:serine/threonine-protein kinase PknK